MRFFLKRLFSVKPYELRWIRKQLADDFTGKDSFRGITLSYAYSANQLGHFTLGFFPVLIIHYYINFLVPGDSFLCQYAVLVAATAVSAWWTIYEAGQYYVTYLSAGNSHFNYLENVFEDTAIDLGFFYLGIYWAVIYLAHIGPVTGAFWIGILMMIILFCYYFKWYLTKIYLQNANYPFQLRLNSWPYSGISEPEQIDRFIRTNNQQHLLIYGPRKRGKTSLAVAIGTELSMKHRKCTYISAMKFKGKVIDQPEDDDFFNWTWQEADCLIIDDVDIYDPLIFAMNHSKFNAKHLKRKIIWVLNTSNKDHQNIIRNDIKNGLSKIMADLVIDDPIYVNITEIDLDEIIKRDLD